MHGHNQVIIVDSEGPSDLCAPLSICWYMVINQMIIFVVVDTFLQCIEFQKIITFKKHNLLLFIIMIINETYIQTIIIVSLKNNGFWRSLHVDCQQCFNYYLFWWSYEN